MLELGTDKSVSLILDYGHNVAALRALAELVEPTGEAAGLLIEAAAPDADGGPSRCGQPTFIPDETDATRAADAESNAGDVLVLCVAGGNRVLADLERRPAMARRTPGCVPVLTWGRVRSQTRIVVTGAAGTLGRSLLPRLAAAGHTVVAFDKPR